MTDMIIWTRRSITIIEPQTIKGKQWIKRKMAATDFEAKSITIQSDTVEEFILELKEDEIIYEER